jgi:hypothetical protein
MLSIPQKKGPRQGDFGTKIGDNPPASSSRKQAQPLLMALSTPHHLRIILTILLLTWVAAPVPGAVRGRLQVAPNGRHLQYTDGTRFFERPMIWILGGDQNVVNPEERAIIDAMAAGLKEGDGGTHLLTFHPRGPGQSSRQVHDASWLDFHMSRKNLL